jgi:coenzyme F420-0:L-glutamate ligase/coenzyme F420-1:gamma-L-glutamate ligase
VDLHLFAVPGIPEVTGGADLGALLARAVARAGRTVEAGDVFVVAQKVVSKAEGATKSRCRPAPRSGRRPTRRTPG